MTELPIAPDLFWFIAGMAGLVFAVAAVNAVMTLMSKEDQPAADRLRALLGLEAMNGGLFFLALCLWGLLLLLLTGGLFWMIWEVAWHSLPTRENVWEWRFLLAQLVALTGVLGAVVALPFTLTRLRLTREQNRTAEDQRRIAETAHFNERLKAASDDLHARREMKHKWDMGKADHSYIEDDIVRRAAAIGALEALARERPAEAPRIGRLLCTYLRELSKLVTPESDEHPRADMEAAAQTVGGLQKIEWVVAEDVQIDLRGANLAGFDLSGLSFVGANFAQCKAFSALFIASTLTHTKWNEADLAETSFLRADLKHSEFIMPQVGFPTAFFRADLEGSAFWHMDCEKIILEQEQVDGLFGDATVQLPPNIDPPEWFQTVHPDLGQFLNAYSDWRSARTSSRSPSLGP